MGYTKSHFEAMAEKTLSGYLISIDCEVGNTWLKIHWDKDMSPEIKTELEHVISRLPEIINAISKSVASGDSDGIYVD